MWQARAWFLQGRHEEAADRAAAVLESLGSSAPLVAADGHVLVGEVAIEQGHVGAARTAFQRAVMVLSAAGADRHAAQLWFDLGGLLERVGESDLALDAFRRAAASTGLSASQQRLHA
jgi:Flp pilus assembly protein TadD